MNFILICCMLISSWKRVFLARLMVYLLLFVRQYFKLGHQRQPNNWAVGPAQREPGADTGSSSAGTQTSGAWEAVRNHLSSFSIFSWVHLVPSWVITASLFFLFTMKTRLQARQNNSSCYRCQDMIAHLRHKECVMVSVLLMVNNSSSVKQHLSTIWCLTIKH